MAGDTMRAMASTVSTPAIAGTVFRGPDGQVAVRMGPTVTVGRYFVITTGNGGYYENDDERVAAIESWARFDEPAPVTPPAKPAPVMPPAPPTS